MDERVELFKKGVVTPSIVLEDYNQVININGDRFTIDFFSKMREWAEKRAIVRLAVERQSNVIYIERVEDDD